MLTVRVRTREVSGFQAGADVQLADLVCMHIIAYTANTGYRRMPEGLASWRCRGVRMWVPLASMGSETCCYSMPGGWRPGLADPLCVSRGGCSW